MAVAVHDDTKVAAVVPPRMLELDARLWPFGVARIRFELTETDPGVTEGRMMERVVRGSGPAIAGWVRALNRESLCRVADLVVGRGGQRP